MQSIQITEENIVAKVTHLDEEKGNFAYLELSLGPIRQRGYVARARLTKADKPWVEIIPPQQKGGSGSFHVTSFIDDKELWLMAIEKLSTAYSEALKEAGLFIEDVAVYNGQREIPKES